jgi:hypothetical protein
MVEPMRAVMNRDEDEGGYKPLAFLAVVAFGASLLFSIVTVTLTIVALVTRRQLLEVGLIPMAFIGVLLSIAGRWQIQRSEGARDGRRLTNIAWWLSVIGGCVYAAYFVGNVMAIKGQSRAFIKDNWMEALRSGRIDEAYYLTLNPDQRKSMTPADVPKRFGDVDAFREEPLPKLFERSAGQCEVDLLDSPEWQETPQGLSVALNSLIKTTLGDYIVSIPALGVLSKDRGAREWYILRANVSVRQVSKSGYGWLLQMLEEDATNVLRNWVMESAGYARPKAYYATLPISKMERDQMWATFIVRGLIAPALDDLMSFPYGVQTPFKLASRLVQWDATIKLYAPETETYGRRVVTWTPSKRPEDKKHERDPEELEQAASLIMDSHHIEPMPGKIGGEVRFEVYPAMPSWWCPQYLRASIDVVVRMPSSRERYRAHLYLVSNDPKAIFELNRLKDKEVSLLKDRGAVRGDKTEAAEIMKKLPQVWRIAELRVDLTPVTADSVKTKAAAPAQ